jgi:hypothetical protein
VEVNYREEAEDENQSLHIVSSKNISQFPKNREEVLELVQAAVRGQ